jgi:hypothetical protein
LVACALPASAQHDVTQPSPLAQDIANQIAKLRSSSKKKDQPKKEQD